MPEYYEVRSLIEALKRGLPQDDRYAVLNYLVSIAEAEAIDLEKILIRDERKTAHSRYQQAAGSGQSS